MRLTEWIDGCLGIAEHRACTYYRAAGSRTELYQWLADETGVSAQTISNAPSAVQAACGSAAVAGTLAIS